MAAVMKTTHHGGCPHDCPDTCSMVFEVEDGKFVKGGNEWQLWSWAAKNFFENANGNPSSK